MKCEYCFGEVKNGQCTCCKQYTKKYLEILEKSRKIEEIDVIDQLFEQLKLRFDKNKYIGYDIPNILDSKVPENTFKVQSIELMERYVSNINFAWSTLTTLIYCNKEDLEHNAIEIKLCNLGTLIKNIKVGLAFNKKDEKLYIVFQAVIHDGHEPKDKRQYEDRSRTSYVDDVSIVECIESCLYECIDDINNRKA